MKYLKFLSFTLVVPLVGCNAQEKLFTITWKNEDVVLKIEKNVPKGTLPFYDGETPVKLNPIPYVDYSFQGWDKALEPIQSDITFNAVFEAGEIPKIAIVFDSSKEISTFTFENTDIDTIVDWGDGEKGDDSQTHEYLEEGSYIIRCYAKSIAAFKIVDGLNGVSSLYFSDTIDKINIFGFRDCDNLKSVRLPSNLTNLNAYTFSNNKVDFYQKIDDVYYLGNEDNDHLYCFGTTNNEEIKIALGCEVLTNNSFKGSDLTEKFTFSNTLKIIGDNALENCANVQELKIPETVEYIGKYAFGHCYSLSKINIPNKIKVIKESAFEYCSILDSISLPNNIEKIEESAFYACSNLALLDLSEVDHLIVGSDEMLEGCSSELKIKVKNNDLKAQYESDDYWKIYNFIV